MNKEDIGYAFTISADLGNGRVLAFQGNMKEGVAKEDMDKEVDKLRSVLDRQQAKSALVGVQQELDVKVMRAKQAREDLERLDAKTEEKGGPTSQERQQREAATIHIKQMDDDVEYKKKFIEQLKEEAK